MLILPVSNLRAAHVCAPIKDIRYYLNGVCVEVFVDDPSVYVVATDGSTLFASRINDPQWTETPQKGPFSIIIPSETIKACKGWTLPEIPLIALPNGRYQLGDVVFSPLDGHFPDWKRATPFETSGEVGQFNPLLVAQCHKSLSTYAGHNKNLPVYLAHNGEKAAVMSYDENAYCLIMPWRGSDPVVPFCRPQELKQAA